MKHLMSGGLASLLAGALLTACTTQDAAEPLRPPPSPCANRGLEWPHQRSEIMHLNQGYDLHTIIQRREFMKIFNALPPVSETPVPDVAGYFSKRGEASAILVFVTGECVTYLEVVKSDFLQDMIRRLGGSK